MFEPYTNWENPYKIDRGGEGGQAILYGYKIANFPKTLDHIPKESFDQFLKIQDRDHLQVQHNLFTSVACYRKGIEYVTSN